MEKVMKLIRAKMSNWFWLSEGGKTHHPNEQKQRERHLPIIAVQRSEEKFVINSKPSGYQDLLASLRYGVLPMYII